MKKHASNYRSPKRTGVASLKAIIMGWLSAWWRISAMTLFYFLIIKSAGTNAASVVVASSSLLLPAQRWTKSDDPPGTGMPRICVGDNASICRPNRDRKWVVFSSPFDHSCAVGIEVKAAPLKRRPRTATLPVLTVNWADPRFAHHAG